MSEHRLDPEAVKGTLKTDPAETYLPPKGELIASTRDIEEIKKFIGCDHLIYQDLNELVDSVTSLSDKIIDVEKSIFDGKYPTNITQEYLEVLAKRRGSKI